MDNLLEFQNPDPPPFFLHLPKSETPYLLLTPNQKWVGKSQQSKKLEEFQIEQVKARFSGKEWRSKGFQGRGRNSWDLGAWGKV